LFESLKKARRFECNGAKAIGTKFLENFKIIRGGNMMKKLILCVTTVFLIALVGTTVLAEEYEVGVADDFLIESFDVEDFYVVTEENGAFEFLHYLDINNLFVLYHDGTMVNAELQEQVIQKLTEGDFSGVVDLIFLHSISFLEKTPLSTSGMLRWQEYSFEFALFTTHNLTRGNLVFPVTVTTRGAVTHHVNGTWTGSGRPTVRVDSSPPRNWEEETRTTTQSGGWDIQNGGRTINVAGHFSISFRHVVSGIWTGDYVHFPWTSFTHRVGG